MAIVRAIDGGSRRDLVLDRVDKANAVSPELVETLLGELARAEADQVRLLVLRSAGPVFCAGLDLDEVLGAAEEARDPDAAVTYRLLGLARLLDRWRTARVHTACVVDGVAAGVGADLVAACDLRLGTERAAFRFPGSRFGLLLGTTHLARLVGPVTASTLVASARKVEAAEAEGLGLLAGVGTLEECDERLAGLESALDTADPLTAARLAVAVRAADPEENRRLVEESCVLPGMAARLTAHRDRALRRRS